MVKKNLTPLFSCLCILFSACLSLALADEYKPTRLSGSAFLSTIYNDASQVFTAVKSPSKSESRPTIVGYLKNNRIFSVPVDNSSNAFLCAANANKQIALRRTGTDGNCYTTLFNAETSSFKDLSVETGATSCYCNSGSGDTHSYWVTLNDSGRVVEMIESFAGFDVIDPLHINIYDGSTTSSYDVPSQYLSIESLSTMRVLQDGVVIWRVNGSMSFLAFDPASNQYFTTPDLTMILPLFLKPNKGSSSLSLDIIGVTAHGALLRGDVFYDTKTAHEIYDYNPLTGIYTTIKGSTKNLWKYDLDSRTPTFKNNQDGDVIFCSIAQKYGLKNSYTLGARAVLPNGDIFTEHYFLKRTKTAHSMPFCYNASFSAEGSCDRLFTPTSQIDTRYGLDGDIMTFPSLDSKQQYHECLFTLKLSRLDGKPFGSSRILLTDQFNNKASVLVDAAGSGQFRVKVDTNNPCDGPYIQGPFRKKDVHTLTKSVWAQHCE